ncbi:hypothetical protein G6F57_001163 [Rhizopus arrhizus]|uniref:Uncharacterized protein n=1 Tax=Rhizopus oryzae TaxID=64495 RepID=A0A9P7BTU0_RHIOR|nr:hypothetical protein G6F30_000080 [Rhizopus arrhizus]KAG1426946.1 hypothetical protein G6F58_001248 [Rhizopus delemar]KAG0987018.1 hypothetical protein G6F29_002834 [Rhizopus arrhizus]KAG1000503.1 hypothetical protein G6F28_000035 [Rhizopus arrhizus]KAG1012277.1 hypothetical protein G6F27_002976 [Rhizopus arrhizus]
MSKSMPSEAVQHAIDSVIRSPSVDVYSYLHQAMLVTRSEEDVKEIKKSNVIKEKETIPKVQQEIAKEDKDEKMVKAKEDVVEEIKETVSPVLPAADDDQGKRVDLKEAVDYGIQSVVDSKCIDLYEYFKNQSLIAANQKTVNSAVEDIKEHAQLLAGAISNKNTKEIKEEAVKISESVKVAATTAAGAGIASVMPSKDMAQKRDEEKKERSGLENFTESVRSTMSHTVTQAQHVAADMQRQLPVIQGQVKESVHHYIERATPATQKMMQSVSDIQNKLNLKKSEEGMDSTGKVHSTPPQSKSKDKKDGCKIM